MSSASREDEFEDATDVVANSGSASLEGHEAPGPTANDETPEDENEHDKKDDNEENDASNSAESASNDHAAVADEDVVVSAETGAVVEEAAGDDVDVPANADPEHPEGAHDTHQEQDQEHEPNATNDDDNGKTETTAKSEDQNPLGESTQQFELSDEDLQRANKSLEEKLDMLKSFPDDEVEEEKDQDQPTDATKPPPPPALPSRDTPALPVLPPRSTPAPPVLPPRDHTVPPTPPPRALPGSPDSDQRHISKQSELLIAAAELQPPPLPPQLTDRQKSKHRGSIFQSWFSGSSRGSTTDSAAEEKEVTYDENYDLLLSRVNENSVDLSSKDEVTKGQINSTHDTLKSSFAATISNIDSNDASELQIDWSFWTDVVNDYTSVAKSDPSRLSKELSNGIPNPIRGIVWQLVSNVNPTEFESQYETLSTTESAFAKNIQKDLSRTSFVENAGVNKDSLYRVIKAYSNIDQEVGYTQGMAFITVPLLMNMTELEAFAMLHKLMYHYNLRSLFLPEMPGLLLKMYQFDRLLEDLLPTLSTHLQRQGVRSSMYASQWFLTFFAYKFPLEIVLRIYDIVITEGIESILKFAVALMQKNLDTLVTLNFDDLLEFLKNQLFHAYLKTSTTSTEKASEDGGDDEEGEGDASETATEGNPSLNLTVAESYEVDQLVLDATEVKILPMTLQRYEQEFSEIHREEKERREEIDELKFRNNQMKREIRKVEASYTILNREHVQIANEMIQGRMKLAELEDENNDLKKQNNVLRERVKQLQNPTTEDTPLPASLEEDLKTTMERNLEVMNKNQELEDQMQALIQEVEELKIQLEEEKLKSAPVTDPSPERKTSASGGLWGKKLFK